MVSHLKALCRSKWCLVIVLSIPAIPVLYRALFLTWTESSYDKMMHTSGEFAARILILTLLISPLRVFFPKNAFWKWMRKHRRWVGLVAFLHAALHAMVYVGYNIAGEKILSDLGRATYVFGWLAMIALLPLAMTSTNWAVKRIGIRNWKRLHRGAYVVALFGFLHWLLKKESGISVPALVHFVPLLLLELYRVFAWLRGQPSPQER